MVHVLSGRAETPAQSRILTYVRDEGPLSRVDLAARLNVSRTTVAAEVGRLVELGLVEDGGLPRRGAGDGRRWWISTPAPLRRRSTSASPRAVAVTDGRLGRAGQVAEGGNIRRRPRTVLAEAIELARRPLPSRVAETSAARHRRARAGQLPGGRPGVAADHAGLGPLPGPRRGLRRTGLPGPGGQRRQRHGAGRDSTPGSPDRSTTSCSSRSAPASAAASSSSGDVYRGADGSAGDIGHIRRRARPDVRLRQPRVPGGVLRRAGALARDAGAARSGASPFLAGRLAEAVRWRRDDVAAAARPVTRGGRPSSARAAAGWVGCSPRWSASSTPG